MTTDLATPTTPKPFRTWLSNEARLLRLSIPPRRPTP